MKKPIKLGLLFCLVATFTVAEERLFGPDAIRIVEVFVTDQATGGCWTNISEVQKYAEDQLRLNGYTITGIQENGFLKADNELEEMKDILKNLPPSLPTPILTAVKNQIYVDNLFVLEVLVNAQRDSQKCWGMAEVKLRQPYFDKSGDSRLATFLRTFITFKNYDNANTILLDLVKDFVADLKDQ